MSFDTLLLVDIPYLALGGDFPHQHSADPIYFCLYILSHVSTGPGRNDSQAGPSNYKGKDKAL